MGSWIVSWLKDEDFHEELSASSGHQGVDCLRKNAKFMQSEG